MYHDEMVTFYFPGEFLKYLQDKNEIIGNLRGMEWAYTVLL